MRTPSGVEAARSTTPASPAIPSRKRKQRDSSMKIEIDLEEELRLAEEDKERVEVRKLFLVAEAIVARVLRQRLTLRFCCFCYVSTGTACFH
jgi:hypothetical protein